MWPDVMLPQWSKVQIRLVRSKSRWFFLFYCGDACCFMNCELVHTHWIIFCLKGGWTSTDPELLRLTHWGSGWWCLAFCPEPGHRVSVGWGQGDMGWPQGTQSTTNVYSAKGSNTDFHPNLRKQSARSTCCKCERCLTGRGVDGGLWGHTGVRGLKEMAACPRAA